jgi:hypothetical protein
MNEQIQQLADEIQQLKLQYRSEVPGSRRAWPESIKSRVRALSELGLRAKEIVTVAGIPYYTIIDWLPEAGKRRYQAKSVTAGQFTVNHRPTPYFKFFRSL